MKYQPLLSVEFRHQYYRNNLCADFELSPTTETTQRLKNHRCQIKTSAPGFTLYGEIENNNLKIPFDSEIDLVFELYLKNQDFDYFTEKEKSEFIYTATVTDSGIRLSLPKDDLEEIEYKNKKANGSLQSSSEHPQPRFFKPLSDKKAFADLYISSRLIKADKPIVTCVIEFKERSYKWAYFIASETNSDATINIIADTVLFEQQNLTTTDIPNSDKYKAAFFSKTPVVGQNNRAAKIELHYQDKNTSKTKQLPSPSWSNCIKVNGEEMLYHLVTL